MTNETDDVAEARRVQKEAVDNPTLLFKPDNLKLFARLKVSNESPLVDEIEASWKGKIALNEIEKWGLEVAAEVFKLTHPGKIPYWEMNMEMAKKQDASARSPTPVPAAARTRTTFNAANEPPDFLCVQNHWVLTNFQSHLYGVDITGKAYKVHPVTEEEINYEHPDFWMSYDMAFKYLEKNRHKHHLDGLGFVVADDSGVIGGTINCCRDPKTGEISESVEKFLAELGSPYCLSKSGTGLHFFCTGTLEKYNRFKDRTFNFPEDVTEEMQANIAEEKSP